MIKLFWNTHNQKKTDSEDKNILKKESANFKWGIYHKKSSDKWIFEILKKIEYKIIESEKDIDKEDILIIIDSSVQEKNELYLKLKLICSKMFLFHLLLMIVVIQLVLFVGKAGIKKFLKT